MIEVISRYRLGFKADEFEGYVFLKDEAPIAQLHMYGEFYTFFWRGVAAWSDLSECLVESTDEIARRAGIPPETLSDGIVRYAGRKHLNTAPFRIIREPSVPGSMYLDILGKHHESFAKKNGPITFARFDVMSGRALPIILWSDLTYTVESEIGFSSQVELPSRLVQLFQSTCRVALDESDLDKISGEVGNYMFATA